MAKAESSKERNAGDGRNIRKVMTGRKEEAVASWW
jgi:hypothetical protein